MRESTYATTLPPPAPPAPPPLGLRRFIYLPLGVLSLGIGIVGLVTPMVPGAVFLILAAWLFARSSPRFERWILEHPTYGPIVIGWRANGAVPRRIKWIALASFVVSFGFAWGMGAPALALGVIALTLTAVGAYLLTRPDA